MRRHRALGRLAGFEDLLEPRKLLPRLRRGFSLRDVGQEPSELPPGAVS
jgi:hypothetical protein